MSITEFSLKNSVLVNMIMIAVFLVGIYALFVIPQEEYPPVDFGAIVVNVNYPGVSPQEIETLIINKIEEQLVNIDGLDYIESTAEEGRASIRVVFEPNIDPDKAWYDFNAEFDKVRDLPADAFEPVVIRLNMREVNSIGQVVIGGDFSRNAMREISVMMRDGLLEIPHVSRVEVFGTQERQVWVQADQRLLSEYGITLNEIVNSIRTRNMNIPGGTVMMGNVEILVRSIGEFEAIEDIRRIVLRAEPESGVVRLADVAAVADTLQEAQTITKLDGEPGVSLYVYKKADGNIVTVMRDVRQYVDDIGEQIPELTASVRNDSSIDVQNSINALGSTALQGIILVFIVLFIFLGWRNALFAAWGIPFSIFATFALLYFGGYTLNTLSIFGVIIVIGMVVDNAVVVIENTHRYREKGFCLKDSVINGSKEVIIPITAAILTTISAFLPMLMMEGIWGQFLAIFPVVVSIALIASLFESVFILPTHIYQYSAKLDKKNKTLLLQQSLVKRYQKLLKKVLKYRGWAVSTFAVVFLALLMVIPLGLIRIQFFPRAAPQRIRLTVQTPLGTTLEQTDKVVSQIEQYILYELPQRSDIDAVVSNVGVIGRRGRQDIKGSNAQFGIDLIDVEEMTYTHEEIMNSMRRYLEQLSGIYTYSFAEVRGGPPVGNDVEIRIKGDNLARLEHIGDVVKGYLEEIPGVVDIEDSIEPGKKEIRILPYHDKLEIYGLDVASISNTIRTASTGSRATMYRGGGIDEYDLIVRLQKEDIEELEQLRNLQMRTRQGNLIALREVAEFDLETGLANIRRRDRKRLVEITAAVTDYEDNGVIRSRSAGEVMEILFGHRIRGTEGYLSNFESRFPGYTIEVGGVNEEQQRSFRSLGQALIVAVLLIYIILAAQFRSYVQPLIVMSAVCFGYIGVVIGLLVTGLPFSLNAFISVIALAGVVVNNSLILLDFINRERDNGVDKWNAIINAGSIRLRPILLTTITTVAGLFPLVISTSRSAAPWRPMAVSFVFGLIFAAVLTLFITPSIYSLVDSFFGKIGITRFKKHEAYENCISNSDK